MDIRDFNIYCINLDSRHDRWYTAEREFKTLSLSVERFSATQHENPIIGCATSHFLALEESMQCDKHAMLFEDDIQFINNAQDIPRYIEWSSYLNWDMLYLGANICNKIIKVNSHFGKLSHAQSTHAYCVNKKFIPDILKHKILLGKHLDLIYTEDIIPYNNCFITIPMLAIQRPSYSDIEKKIVNYSWMEERYNRNLE